MIRRASEVGRIGVCPRRSSPYPAALGFVDERGRSVDGVAEDLLRALRRHAQPGRDLPDLQLALKPQPQHAPVAPRQPRPDRSDGDAPVVLGRARAFRQGDAPLPRLPPPVRRTAVAHRHLQVLLGLGDRLLEAQEADEHVVHHVLRVVVRDALVEGLPEERAEKLEVQLFERHRWEVAGNGRILPPV
jgi:hypothetical protein